MMFARKFEIQGVTFDTLVRLFGCATPPVIPHIQGEVWNVDGTSQVFLPDPDFREGYTSAQADVHYLAGKLSMTPDNLRHVIGCELRDAALTLGDPSCTPTESAGALGRIRALTEAWKEHGFGE